MDKIFVSGWLFSSEKGAEHKILSANLDSVSSLTCSQLQTNALNFTVWSNDQELMTIKGGTPVVYLRDDKRVGTYYAEEIRRKSATKYYFSALSAVDLLDKRDHPGGIYTGQTAAAVVRDICGAVPVYIKGNLTDIALYGWLPYASARDNLAQVLFAIGASLGTDLNGVLRVEPLWDGVSSTVTPERMYEGGSVAYGSAVSSVSVTEHQYVQGTEERELFSGAAWAGDLITFDEPMHSLSATGFAIQSSGANWARISAGTGVLKGKAYIHTTRQVTEPVTPGAAENVKTIKAATLVSLVNSVAVAKRLAEYYRCTETIKNPVVAGAERPGHVVSIYHPYDKIYVPACISNADTTMSATLKSDLTALVGFRPPQPDDAQYFDKSVVLTSSQNWIVPNGVTAIRVVLIGAGQGGGSGLDGADSKQTGTHGTNTVNGNTRRFATADVSKAALGGNPGTPGSGGKIFEFTMDVSPGQQFAAVVGIGGAGGIRTSGEESVPGQPGGATTFAGRTSDSGTPNKSGYTDVVNHAVYATPGDSGVKGGNGAGLNEDETAEIPAESVTAFGDTFLGGSNTTDQYLEEEAGSANLGRGYKYAEAYGGYGGGAAYGARGRNGDPPAYAEARNASASAHGGIGGYGANALPPPIPSVLGKGGYGGNGGGAAGSCGPALAENVMGPDVTSGASLNVTYGTSYGGTGSSGGQGAPGCVIIYYRLEQHAGHGPLVTADGKMFLDGLGRRFIV